MAVLVVFTGAPSINPGSSCSCLHSTWCDGVLYGVYSRVPSPYHVRVTCARVCIEDAVVCVAECWVDVGVWLVGSFGNQQLSSALVPPPQTTKGNKHHYIRTDDGESLCKYIEAFSKNPEHAMVSTF